MPKNINTLTIALSLAQTVNPSDKSPMEKFKRKLLYNVMKKINKENLLNGQEPAEPNA